MQSRADLEQVILENLRQLPLDKQQEVLDFTEFLRQKITEQSSSASSLRQIAAMPVADRHRILAQSIVATAYDFQTDPELTEFAVLDTEDWEVEHG